jgi:hypothetical protein
METDLEANRGLPAMSTTIKIEAQGPLKGKLRRLRRRCSKLFRKLFGGEGAIETERQQVGAKEFVTILPLRGHGRTPATPRRVHPTKPKVAVKKNDRVDGFRNLERRAGVSSEKKREEFMKAEEQRDIAKVEPGRSSSAAKPKYHGRTEVSMGSVELVDLKPLPEEDTEAATYQRWKLLASKESTAMVFESGGAKSKYPIAHITQWPPQPTREAPSPPVHSDVRDEYSGDDVGSTADVSDDEYLDDGPQLYDGQNEDSANNDSSGQLQRESFSQVYQDSQIRSSLDASKAFEESEAKFSTPKRSKTDPSSEKHSAKTQGGERTPRYLDFFARLFPSRPKKSPPVRPRSMSAPTPATGTPFEDPSPGRKNNWKGTEAFLIGMNPSPSPTMTEEEFRAQYFLRDPDRDAGYMKMNLKIDDRPDSHQQANGLNIQDVDIRLNVERIESLHEVPRDVVKEANEDEPRPLRRKKAFDMSQVKGYPSLDSLSEKCDFGTHAENDLPEYIRRLRSKAMDEPTTEAEAAKRYLLKQDRQLQEDFAHYTKLQQNKRSPAPSRSPAFELSRYGPGHLHRSPATPGGLLMTKSAPAQGENRLPFPLLMADGEKAQSDPNKTGRSQTVKTRRRANATYKKNPSVTRFPVRPSQSASPASLSGRQSPHATSDTAHQSSPTVSTPRTPSSVTMRRTKFDKPFEFPAKTPTILERLSECSSTADLKSDDQVGFPQSDEGVIGEQLPPDSRQPPQPAFIQPLVSQSIVPQPATQRPRGDSNGLRPLILQPPVPWHESKALTQMDSSSEPVPALPDQDVPRKTAQRSRGDSQGLRPFRLQMSASPQGSGVALPAFDAGMQARPPVLAPPETIPESTIQRSRVGSQKLRLHKVQASIPPVMPQSSHNHFRPKRKVEDSVIEGGVDGAVDDARDMEMSRKWDEREEERVMMAKKVKVQVSANVE